MESSIDEITVIADENLNAIVNMSERLTEIASHNQELNASIEEIAAAMNSLSGDAQNVNALTVNLSTIGNDIFEVAKSMQGIEVVVTKVAEKSGNLASNNLFKLSNDNFVKFLEAAIIAHQGWVNNLEGMVSSMKVTPIQTNDHKCGFGHFYYSVKPNHAKIIPPWKEIEYYHHSLHKKGDTVIERIRVGDKDGAVSHLREAEHLSHEIIDLINKLITISKDITAKNENVL